MLDVIDYDIWIGIFILTGILYLINHLRNRDKRTVYRISPDSLERSKKVIMSALPIIEDEKESRIIDQRKLAYPKENIKSAAKILAYYYWTKKQPEELSRVQNAYIELSRFQNTMMSSDEQAREMMREKKANEREFTDYLNRSPFSVAKKKSKNKG